MTKLKQAAAARQTAEHRLETLRITAESVAMEKALALLESPQPVPIPWTDFPQFDGFSQWPAGYDVPYYWTDREDRMDGRYRPLYETPLDLKRIRADARRMQALFPIAKGIFTTLSDYIIGEGFEFTAQPRMQGAEELTNRVQQVVDGFLDFNGFNGNLDREIHETSRTDGETFPTLYVVKDENEVRIELTEPDCILEPLDKHAMERYRKCGHKLNFWYHGVHTQFNLQLKRDDTTRPLGYHAVFDREGDQWDYLPASRVEHIKRNVGRGGRRGVSDLLAAQKDLEAEAKIRRNTAEGAAVLAAIVMIREWNEGTTGSTVERMVQNSSTSTYNKMTQDGPRPTSREQLNPGTVKDMPKGATAQLGPLGTLRSPVYIEVAQYLGRIIGAPWKMPEFLITGDASNANFASSLVAESPFIKYCEHEQQRYAWHFERIIWKALRMYWELGAFGGISWQVLCAAVKIMVDYSSPASRDQLAMAQTNETLNNAGVMSKRTWAAQSGLDYDEEVQQIAKEPKPEPPPSPFGMPPGPSGGFMRRPESVEASPRLESLAERALARLIEGNNQ